MKALVTIVIGALLISAGPSFSADLSVPPTATAAEWRYIRKLTTLFVSCGGTDWKNERDCARSHRMQAKMAKQGFCFFKRLHVGKLVGPEGNRCIEIFDPDRD